MGATQYLKRKGERKRRLENDSVGADINPMGPVSIHEVLRMAIG